MRTRILISLLFVTAAVFLSCGQNDKISTNLDTDLDTVSYALGLTFGSSLQQGGLEDINIEAMAMAIQHLFDGEATEIEPQMANLIINDYFSRIHFGDNLEEGEDFLAENKLRDEVTTTESGIQYEVIQMGDGPKPSSDDEVLVHYEGTLIDGTVFDSSYERGEPAQFVLSQVIPGWTEVMQLMPVGSKWKVYIPQELAYGANPRQGGAIEPFMMLIFEIELLDIVSG